MNTNIEKFFYLFKNENIIGLKSINLTSFYLTILNYSNKFNINKTIDEILEHSDEYKKNIYEKFNMFSFSSNIKDNEYLYTKLISNIKNIIQKNNNLNIINDIFKYYLENDTQLSVKEYFKYYNHNTVINYISLLLKDFIDNKDNKNKYILEGNIKVNSFISSLSFNNIDSKKIYAYQNNNDIKDLVTTELFLKKDINLSNNIISNDILINDFHDRKMFDLIIFDLQMNMHNIIHANCCDRIKKLKIRGTKVEPLLLQLIMISLNKNGHAIIICPDSLLFGSSTQQVETRKYLLENFNVSKIIEIDESLYYSKGNKTSIIYFKNDGQSTTNITFSNIRNVIKNINIDLIKNNDYNLYYKSYEFMNEHMNEHVNKHVNTNGHVNNINIYPCKDIGKITDMNNILWISKYYKNEQSIKLSELHLENYNIYEYFIICKDGNNKYILSYLEKHLNDHIDSFVTGKMRQININLIENLNVPFLSKDKQEIIENVNTSLNEIYDSNNSNIGMYNNIINNIIKLLNKKDIIHLCDIATINTNNIDIKNINSKIIGIIKNGLKAGTVYLTDVNSDLSNNSHYLLLNNNDYIIEYIYYYLYVNQDKLIEKSNLTVQSNLPKTSLALINIPKIDKKKQEYIVKLMLSIDKVLDETKKINNHINDINININHFT